MRSFRIIMLSLLLVTTANADDFILKSPAFLNNAKIPIYYTCDGGNHSPELIWANAPTKTKAFVLTLSTSDYTSDPLYLWVLYNIPASMTSLAKEANANLPNGILEGKNFYLDETNYRGPCPPDAGLHHYTFDLYAIDTILDLPAGEDADRVFQSMRGHVLKKTQLLGTFSH